MHSSLLRSSRLIPPKLAVRPNWVLTPVSKMIHLLCGKGASMARVGVAAVEATQGKSLSWILGQRIRAARLAKGWSQGDLAERTDILRSNVARLESGRHSPSVETVAVLADALSLRLAELFEIRLATVKLRRLNERRSRKGVKTLRNRLSVMRHRGIIDKSGSRIRRELPAEMLEGTSDAV